MPRARPRAGVLELRLYVAGGSPNSARAVTNLEALCARLPAGAWRLETIDVLAEPQRSLDDGVLVTPTLIRRVPRPVVQVIGDLRDHEAVLAALGVEPGRQ